MKILEIQMEVIRIKALVKEGKEAEALMREVALYREVLEDIRKCGGYPGAAMAKAVLELKVP